MNLLIVILGQGGAVEASSNDNTFQVMIKNLNLMSRISSQTM